VTTPALFSRSFNATLGLIALMALIGYTVRFTAVKPEHGPDFSLIPYELGDFHGVEERFAEYQYSVLKADTTTLRRYVDSDGVVYWLFVAFFQSQKYGSQIHSPRNCLPGGGWRIERSDVTHLVPPVGAPRDANQLAIGFEDKRQTMIYWFETRGGSIRSEFGLKLDLMRNALAFRPTDAAFVRLTVSIPSGDPSEMVARATRFLDTFMSHIDSALPFAKTAPASSAL